MWNTKVVWHLVALAIRLSFMMANQSWGRVAVRHSNVVVVKRLIMTSVAAVILKLCASLLLMMVNTIQFDRDILVQVNNYNAIVVNVFHISHNLTWYSAIDHKFTRIYQVWSTYELTNNSCKFVWKIGKSISKRITCKE